MAQVNREDYDKLADIIYDWHYEHGGECDPQALGEITNQVLNHLGFDSGFKK